MKSEGHRDVEASLQRIETTRSSGIESNKSGLVLVSSAGEIEEGTHRRLFVVGIKTPEELKTLLVCLTGNIIFFFLVLKGLQSSLASGPLLSLGL